MGYVDLLAQDHYNVKVFHGLQASDTGFDGTVRNVESGNVRWLGYILHENNSSVAWAQVFFRPASEVILGTTPPDFTILMAADESVAWDFRYPLDSTNGLSIGATTTETGSTAVTTAVTGSILYKIPQR